MKYIIYSHSDNRLGVIYPIDSENAEQTATDILGVNALYSIVDTVDIDTFFFDAYEYSNNAIRINMEKAKNIWKNIWREKRAKIFERLDIEFMKAVESGNIAMLQTIKDKKQALRDVTSTELPNSLNEIRNTWPSILNI